MKPSRLLLSLSVLLASGLSASAGELGSAARVSKWVEAALLEPLQRREAERSKYSRARMPPAARQVHLLEGSPEADRRGRVFVRFAVDEKRLAAWERNALTGCVYVEDGAVFVQRGAKVQSAAQYLGKGGPAATNECTAATVASNGH